MFPTLALFVIVVPFTSSGRDLTPKRAFPTMAVLSFVGFNVFMCINGILHLSEALVGVSRISVSTDTVCRYQVT